MFAGNIDFFAQIVGVKVLSFGLYYFRALKNSENGAIPQKNASGALWRRAGVP